MKNIDKTLNKVKYSAFGKVKCKRKVDMKDISEHTNEKLLAAQRIEIESELSRIKDLKVCKGKAAAVFDLLDNIRGGKKQGAEIVAMSHPSTGELVLDPDHLKDTALDYCVELLQNNNCDSDCGEKISTENLLNYNRVREDDISDVALTFEDFKQRIHIVAAKSGEKYKFLLNSGQSFKNCFFTLFSRVWNTEVKPKQWRNTVIVQLNKQKGDINSFDSQRNIHTKDFIPKLFEGIVVDKSKELIISACSKFQIGGMPKHRSQEHLFSVKSVIQLYSQFNQPLFIQIFDIAKYFDNEILKDAMDTLHKSGVRGKLYRLWYELYRDTQIRVKTAAGITDCRATGKNVCHGSIGGALLSSANLDKTISAYLSGSDCELSYGDKRLSPLLFQDDDLRLANSIELAQKGNIFIESAIKRKQLSLNIEKCSILVFDKKDRVQKIRDSINEENKLRICDKSIKAKNKDDYLGDVLHEGSLTKSVQATIEKRYGKIFMAICEVSSILNDYRIDTVGGLLAGLEIFDLAITPCLLNNADTWTLINADAESKLDYLQNLMFRSILGVPESTPKPLLRFDLGSLSMAEKVHAKKLNFIHHLKYSNPKSLAHEIYSLQVNCHFPGLVNECRKLLQMYSLPNIIDSNIDISKECWKKKVKVAVRKKSEERVKEDMLNYSKLKEIGKSEESLGTKDYLKNMSLRYSRTMFRIRSFMTNVKMNKKSDKTYAEALWKCDFCKSLDSQSHILWCPAFSPLREGKSLNSDLDLVKYVQEVMRIREAN